MTLLLTPIFTLQSKKRKSQGLNVVTDAEEESIGQRVRKPDGRKRTSSFLKNKDFLYETPQAKKSRNTKSNLSEGTKEQQKEEGLIDDEGVLKLVNKLPIFEKMVNIDDIFVEQRHMSVLTKEDVKDPKDKWMGDEVCYYIGYKLFNSCLKYIFHI